MSFSHIILQLFIGPLQLIYEFIFAIADLMTHSYGLSILMLSLVMNFMLLPLYKQADAIQDQERTQEKEMSYWVKHIKKTFSGNERFMMLQAYYRQNNYKPYYALKGMLPLLLEIPFFIAAYRYLSTLDALRYMPFGPIADLSLPDGLIRLGELRVNVLPILMTVINIVSSAIYTKGLRVKDKIQLYGMAALFLILLYDSPSGLVMYWTMNNLFSLIKNAIGKMKNPRAAFGILMSALGVGFVLYTLIWIPQISVFGERLPLMIIGVLMQIPLVLWLIRRRIPAKERIRKERTPKLSLYLTGCLLLTLITGFLIPSAVISASPIEFVLFSNFRLPQVHVVDALLLAAGFFMVWFGLVYYLSGKNARWFLCVAIWVFSGIAIVNYMFFGTKLGTLSAELKYDGGLDFGILQYIINSVVVLALIPLLCWIFKKSRKVVQGTLVVLCLAVFGMSVVNMFKIRSAVPEIEAARANVSFTSQADGKNGPGKIIRLSKNRKNVIVLMLDRAISIYIPYFFAEKPELQEKFAGFTYYPNTLSYGQTTNYASAALYGGYEYRPKEINNRSSESLVSKQNEALKVMPILFDRNNYRVTVIEPTYAGYQWVPDLSIFDEYPSIRENTYNLEQGQMVYVPEEDLKVDLPRIWERNFFCFGLMKITPCIAQLGLYQNGSYFSSSAQTSQRQIGLYTASGVNNAFMKSYAVMKGLTDITAYEDIDRNTFLMMSNSMTHEPQMLQEPEYKPSRHVDNTQYEAQHADRFTQNGQTLRMDTDARVQHYQIDMAAMLCLGDWFDQMRENDVYNNTRIIIVADHGFRLKQIDSLVLGPGELEDVMSYNPLLLVKDFDSTEFTTDDRFMTNADVPTLAFDRLIIDPVNPFTGKAISNEAKQGEQYVILSNQWDTKVYHSNVLPAGQWYSVHDNIFDLNNWTKRDWQ